GTQTQYVVYFFFFQAEDGIRDGHVTGVQTCALPIWKRQGLGPALGRYVLDFISQNCTSPERPHTIVERDQRSSALRYLPADPSKDRKSVVLGEECVLGGWGGCWSKTIWEECRVRRGS